MAVFLMWMPCSGANHAAVDCSMDPQLHDLMARLDKLSDDFAELREGVRKAVLVADVDPEMTLTRSRKVLEYVVRDVFERRVMEPPGTRPLENLLQRLVKDGFLPERPQVVGRGNQEHA
jgi:hypothetical protein